MPDRKAPPIGGIVVGIFLLGVIAVVVTNRAVNTDRARRGDVDTPRAVALVPQSESSILAQVRELEGEGRTPEAVPLLRTHLDETPDDFEALKALRRVLPKGQKAELGERLARCSNPSSVFSTLLDDAQNSGDDEAFAALTTGLKKVCPNDARLPRVEIRSKVILKQYADAVELFRKHFPAIAEDVRDLFLTEFLFDMSTEKQHLLAYTAMPASHAATAYRTLLDSLVTRLTVDREAKERAIIQALTAAHRVCAPRDPMLWYAEGVLLRYANEFEQAEKVLAEGHAMLAAQPRPKGDDNSRSSEDAQFRVQRVDCLYQARKGLEAYERIGPAEATFVQLAWMYELDKDVRSLDKLVAAHKAKVPHAPELAYWEAVVLYRKEDYAAAVRAFEACRHKYPASTPEWSWIHERLVRSHLRMGNATAALEVLANPSNAGSIPLRAAVLAALGNVESLDAMLAEHLKRMGDIGWFHDDEDFAREFAAKKYAELRKKYPAPTKKP